MSASEAWRSTRRSFIRQLLPQTARTITMANWSSPARRIRWKRLSARASISGEKNAGAANWTDDDVVWHILPERTRYIVDVDAPLVNNLPADAQPETDANDRPLVIHATKREEATTVSINVDYGTSADKMTFINTYTRSSGGGGGRQQRVHHGKQDRRSGQAPCRRILRVEGQPGTGGLSGHLERQRASCASPGSATAPIRCWKRLLRRIM